MKSPSPESYDLCVVGANPAGIAAAVRTARLGHRVLLTQHNRHLGGMCTNGLCQWDAKSDHRRCPIFAEILERLETHYRETYGAGSEEFHAARYSVDRYPVGCFEPSVIEGIFNDMVRAESGITVLLDVVPGRIERDADGIRRVAFREKYGETRCTVDARLFVDATYEGDLAALAGVPVRVGREARDEYDEPHAGVLYTRIEGRPAPELAVRGEINLIPFSTRHGGHDPASPQTADHRIQAYNLRPCVSRRPENRILPETPPDGYDRREFQNYRRRKLAISAHIHGKNSYNSAILPGENWEYPEGDWATRDRIAARHREFALGWMWFLQHDSSVPEDIRAEALRWGLAADEFTDNGHLPYEMYVRETRRIVGRHVLTENDLSPRRGFMRPRPFEDSVAFTDWYMDSHSCSRDLGTWGPEPHVAGHDEYPFEGKLILSEECRPGMIPYRSLVTDACPNLLVPVCLSCTHVAWGAVRLEPLWIHLGEVAGFAACQALASVEALNRLDVTRLQKTLLAAGASVAFFNQHPQVKDHPKRAERELAACHGDWDAYDFHTKK